jgi:hypothetical protein
MLEHRQVEERREQLNDEMRRENARANSRKLQDVLIRVGIADDGTQAANQR